MDGLNQSDIRHCTSNTYCNYNVEIYSFNIDFQPNNTFYIVVRVHSRVVHNNIHNSYTVYCMAIRNFLEKNVCLDCVQQRTKQKRFD